MYHNGSIVAAAAHMQSPKNLCWHCSSWRELLMETDKPLCISIKCLNRHIKPNATQLAATAAKQGWQCWPDMSMAVTRDAARAAVTCSAVNKPSYDGTANTTTKTQLLQLTISGSRPSWPLLMRRGQDVPSSPKTLLAHAVRQLRVTAAFFPRSEEQHAQHVERPGVVRKHPLWLTAEKSER